MSNYRPYPKYKDSGVEWLGEVPEGWSFFQGRRIFEQKRDPSSPDDDQLSATQKYGVIPQALFMEQEDQKVVLALSGTGSFKHVQKDDFVISLRSFQGGIEHSAYSGCVSPAYTVLRNKKPIAPRYCAQLLKSPQYVAALQAGTDGIREGKSISYEQFGQITIPLPPLPEQIQIASFLDGECGKLDALQAKQERLIELLKEKRQALISHAVTKGLDPAAKLKPSGIEWLGDVPEHWVVTRLKLVATIQTGIAKGKDNGDKPTISVPYLRVANVQDGYLDLEEVASIEIPAEVLPRYTLKSGDVLMNEGGDFDKLGRGHVWRGEISPCIHQNHVFAIRPISITCEWLNMLTCSSYAQFYFMSRSKQSTNLASLSSTNLMELPVLRPPLAEQRAIVAHLDEKCGKIDELKAKAERAIGLLKERRSALISAAVTGKIDVRDA
jgi:type I restriction enzyme S subunit